MITLLQNSSMREHHDEINSLGWDGVTALPGPAPSLFSGFGQNSAFKTYSSNSKNGMLYYYLTKGAGHETAGPSFRAANICFCAVFNACAFGTACRDGSHPTWCPEVREAVASEVGNLIGGSVDQIRGVISEIAKTNYEANATSGKKYMAAYHGKTMSEAIAITKARDANMECVPWNPAESIVAPGGNKVFRFAGLKIGLKRSPCVELKEKLKKLFVLDILKDKFTKMFPDLQNFRAPPQ